MDIKIYRLRKKMLAVTANHLRPYIEKGTNIPFKERSYSEACVYFLTKK